MFVEYANWALANFWNEQDASLQSRIEELEREWVSVEEEPSRHDYYLVYFSHEMDNGVSVYYFGKDGWQFKGVTHWQPLPPAPDKTKAIRK